MTNKLYVANVPFNASEDALRRHFETCGGVSEVEIMLEPRSGKPRGFACVTMTSPAYASAALGRLHGATFGGRVLQVSDAPLGRDKPPPPIKIMLQFRERANMAYDLDCTGVSVTLRIYPADDGSWRLEARTSDATHVAEGSGKTRREALAELVRAWNEVADDRGAKPLDGEALYEVMHEVKAV
jgi:RNA recognition motif-containing protein